MNNPSDDNPSKKNPRESPVDINDARGQTVFVRNMLIVLLAFTSGFIDALSFLGLGVFASVQTGNTVLLGLAIGSGKIFQVLVSMAAITGYIGGVALGARIVDPTSVPKKIWPTTVTKAFAIEILVLLLLAIVGFNAGGQPSGPILYTLIALATIAMGIQGAAVRALGVSDVSTTYITGTWTGLISGLVGRRSTTIPGEKKLETRIQAAVVIVYVLAAVAGGIAVTDWSVKATIIPVISIGLVIAVARIRIP
jgi:uncharacterized membrane protein YoaK (UPF0700 family)